MWHSSRTMNFYQVRTYFGYDESPRPSTAKDTPAKEVDGRFLLRINLQNFYWHKIYYFINHFPAWSFYSPTILICPALVNYHDSNFSTFLLSIYCKKQYGTNVDFCGVKSKTNDRNISQYVACMKSLAGWLSYLKSCLLHVCHNKAT